MKSSRAVGLTLACAPLAVLAQGADARLAPAVGVTYQLSVHVSRDDGRGPRLFDTRRLVRFARVPDGVTATLSPVPEAAVVAVHDRFAALTHAVTATPLTVTLTPDCRILSIADADATWARLRTALADAGAPAAVLALHDATPPGIRDATLAEDIVAICAAPDASLPSGTTATSFTGTDGATIPARRTVVRHNDATIVIVSGEGALPGGAGGTVAIVASRRIDRRTGLALSQRVERRVTITDGDGHPHPATTITERALTPMVSEYPSAKPPKP